MLSDAIRTNAYREAMLELGQRLKQKTVLDVGTGTGILSIFAVQAEAAKVYAIDACEIAQQARLVVKENKMADQIEVMQGLVEEFDLPEKVDVLVSEWMGYCLLYESMLPSVLRARDMFLRPGGLMLPCSATLYLAPIHDEKYLERINMWKGMKEKYNVSMETMLPAAHASLSADAHICQVPPEAIQAEAAEVCSLDLTSVSAQDVGSVQSPFSFKCFRNSTITGFVTWFTVDFPGGSSLTTSPFHPVTHWKQTTLHLTQSFSVQHNTSITGVFAMREHPKNHRCMEIEVKFQVDGGSDYRQSFSLHNTCPGRQLRQEDH